MYRVGILALAVAAALLLTAVNAETTRLIPLYAIGVFIGFTLSQSGLVRHWLGERAARWRVRIAVNGIGAVMTAVATVVFLVSKFLEGAWVVVVAVPRAPAFATSEATRSPQLCLERAAAGQLEASGGQPRRATARSRALARRVPVRRQRVAP